MIRRLAFLFCLGALVLALPVRAQNGAGGDAATMAQQAAADLATAADGLARADRGRDRVAALTRVVRAYEDGLSALREGIRNAVIREAALRAELDARRDDIAQLLGILAAMEQTPDALPLLHPSGALGTARSGMILSEIAPGLQARATVLKIELEELALVVTLQQSAAEWLAEGLEGIQTARTRLSQAIADRGDLPDPVATDEAEMARLREDADTLDAFATGIAESAAAAVAVDLPDFAQARGALPLPVAGRVLRRFNEADAAGVTRPGLILGTRPMALITAPVAATVRYAGPFPDYGNVMILEPEAGSLVVLGGMDQVYAPTGTVLAAGAPIGMMGGPAEDSRTAEPGGAALSETLYLEIRQGGSPVDPAPWFSVTKDG
ncbi:MAG: peptidoglycan DD-metalloendopeptidase family protein [Celeribacter sp.]|jgi:septal ring factor EnvC (AmiA/AmiB activator)